LSDRYSPPLHDVDTLPALQRAAVLDPASYVASQALARALRDAGSDGVLYPSVRDASGRCLAVFWPNVVGIPHTERRLQYAWDGSEVARYFDYSLDRWVAL
jgi:hypothetical protein